MSELTPQQAQFVKEYLVDLNGTKAAIRSGYSEVAAKQQASRLLSNANVWDSIQEGRKKRGDRVDLKADRVVLELMRIAFTDLGKLADWDGDQLTYKPSADLSDDDIASVAEITDKTTVTRSGGKGDQVTNERREVKLKQHDKLKALDLLGRHLGIYKADDTSTNANALGAMLELLKGGGITIDQIVAHLAAAAKKPA